MFYEFMYIFSSYHPESQEYSESRTPFKEARPINQYHLALSKAKISVKAFSFFPGYQPVTWFLCSSFCGLFWVCFDTFFSHFSTCYS